jgi:hypothetical protein
MSDQLNNKHKEAIIFIAPLGAGFVDKSMKNIAYRMALALDRNAKTATVKFEIEIKNEPLVSKASKGKDEDENQIYSICKKANDEKMAFIDLYGLDYNKSLIRDYEESNLFIKTLRLFLAIFTNSHRLIPVLLSFNRKNFKAKTFSAKLQFVFGVAILCLLIIYVFSLFLAIYNVVFIQFSGLKIKIFSAFLSWKPINVTLNMLIKISPVVVLLVSFLELFKPNLKEIFAKSSIEFVSVIDYLSLGIHRDVINGKLADLVEYIVEKQIYQNIHIISYSFGAIVAIDSLFPSGRQPGERFNNVNTLVTIGCPFDFLRVFWPGYFNKRQGLIDSPKRWLNIYSPVDIFASNFRDDSKNCEAEKTVNLTNLQDDVKLKPKNIVYSCGLEIEELSFWAWLTLMGIRAHTMYWEPQFESEISCFDILIPKMYENSDFLK